MSSREFFQKTNKWIHFYYLVCDVFSFVFRKKLKTPKRHFKINQSDIISKSQNHNHVFFPYQEWNFFGGICYKIKQYPYMHAIHRLFFETLIFTCKEKTFKIDSNNLHTVKIHVVFVCLNAGFKISILNIFEPQSVGTWFDYRPMGQKKLT